MAAPVTVDLSASFGYTGDPPEGVDLSATAYTGDPPEGVDLSATAYTGDPPVGIDRTGSAYTGAAPATVSEFASGSEAQNTTLDGGAPDSTYTTTETIDAGSL